MRNKHIGSSFSSFLDQEDVFEKRSISGRRSRSSGTRSSQRWNATVTRTELAELAERMRTSRTVVNRLLDRKDTSFTFGTLARASRALDLNRLVSLARKRRPVPSHRYE